MKGFTLIEILVSVAIFTIAMVIALGALLTMSVADRKAESLKSVIDNLNFALDSMSRAIRVGKDYHCGSDAGLDCAINGDNYFTFTTGIDESSVGGNKVDYRLNSTVGGSVKYPDAECENKKGCIQRQVEGKGFTDLTSPEVIICDFSSSLAAAATCPQISSPAISSLFYLLGSPRFSTGDFVQPKLVITLYGIAQVTPTQTTPLHFQTTITQRQYDQ